MTAAISRPASAEAAARACPIPVALSGMSVQPCSRPSRFQSVSPCRTRWTVISRSAASGVSTLRSLRSGPASAAARVCRRWTPSPRPGRQLREGLWEDAGRRSTSARAHAATVGRADGHEPYLLTRLETKSDTVELQRLVLALRRLGAEITVTLPADPGGEEDQAARRLDRDRAGGRS